MVQSDFFYLFFLFQTKGFGIHTDVPSESFFSGQICAEILSKLAQLTYHPWYSCPLDSASFSAIWTYF